MKMLPTFQMNLLFWKFIMLGVLGSIPFPNPALQLKQEAPERVVLASNLKTECFTFNGVTPHTGKNLTTAELFEGSGKWALVIFEGFDAKDVLNPSNYHSMIAPMTDKLPEKPDIWVINYGWGGASIKDCLVPAAKDLVLQINQYYSNKGLAKLPMSVLGISMGGLVGRITLAQLEAENKLPNVVSFLSMDSPQSGATGDPHLNAFIQQIHSTEYSVLKKFQSSDARNALLAASCPAAKQMLYCYPSKVPVIRDLLDFGHASEGITDMLEVDAQAHENFIKWVRSQGKPGSRGYPTSVNLYAISFGMAPQTPGQEYHGESVLVAIRNLTGIIDFDPNKKIETPVENATIEDMWGRRDRVTGGISPQKSRTLQDSFDRQFFGALGQIAPLVNLAFNVEFRYDPTFIPLMSAFDCDDLDLVAKKSGYLNYDDSPFHKVWYPIERYEKTETGILTKVWKPGWYHFDPEEMRNNYQSKGVSDRVDGIGDEVSTVVNGQGKSLISFANFVQEALSPLQTKMYDGKIKPLKILAGAQPTLVKETDIYVGHTFDACSDDVLAIFDNFEEIVKRGETKVYLLKQPATRLPWNCQSTAFHKGENSSSNIASFDVVQISRSSRDDMTLVFYRRNIAAGKDLSNPLTEIGAGDILLETVTERSGRNTIRVVGKGGHVLVPKGTSRTILIPTGELTWYSEQGEEQSDRERSNNSQKPDYVVVSRNNQDEIKIEFRKRKLVCTGPGSDAVDLSKFIQVGITNDACSNIKLLTFTRRGTTVCVAPGESKIFDLGVEVSEVNWICEGTPERAANGTPFQVVRVQRGINGEINWTFFRKIIPTTPSDQVDLNKYDMVGTTQDACSYWNPVRFKRKGAEVQIGSNGSGIYDLGIETTEMPWNCANSTNRVANDLPFRLVRIVRSNTGAITWTFYREKMISSPNDPVNLTGSIQVGQTKDACSKVNYIYLKRKGATVRVAPNDARVFDLGTSVRELLLVCGTSSLRVANDSPFQYIQIARSATGAITWTFYTNLAFVGDSYDGCDGDNVVTIAGTQVGRNETKRIDLGYLTKELRWYCGNSDQRVAIGELFNVVECSRASNGAITWRFYRKGGPNS